MLTPCDSYNYPSILSLFLYLSFPLICPFILLLYLCLSVCGSVQVQATPSEATGGCRPGPVGSLAVGAVSSMSLLKLLPESRLPPSRRTEQALLRGLSSRPSLWLFCPFVCAFPFTVVELSFSNSTQLEHFKVSEFTSYNLRISIFYWFLGFFFCLLGFRLLLFLSSFLPDELLILFSIFFFYLTINI